MNLIKVKFLQNGEPIGKSYTYICNLDVKIDDILLVENKKVIVTELNINENEIEVFKDKIKEIKEKQNNICFSCEKEGIFAILKSIDKKLKYDLCKKCFEEIENIIIDFKNI